jgi:hypothetical protein
MRRVPLMQPKLHAEMVNLNVRMMERYCIAG